MLSAVELTQQALALHQKGDLEDAGSLYEDALRLDPHCFEARSMLGRVRLSQGRVHDATAELEKALVLKPDSLETLCSLGNALAAAQRYDEAVACYNGALSIRPDYFDALNNRGNTLSAVALHHEAIASYDAAVAVHPQHPAPYFNRGLARFALHQRAEAIADFDAVLARDPGHAEALQVRGHALRILRRDEEAAASYNEAVRRDPSLKYAMGDALHARMQLCDWTDHESALQRMLDGVKEGRPVAVPFVLLTLSDDPQAQLACATRYAQINHSLAPVPFGTTRRSGPRKIRLAYLSAKFHNHAGARLIAELLELHDRERFDLFGVSFGPKVAGDRMVERLESCFREFIDVRTLGDSDIVELIRARGVDIAVDLVGYGENARTNIFALRAAPVQVSFLGYPGTMGAPFIDYIVGDEVVIPRGYEHYYSEQVVRLAATYQVNDSKKRISERTPSRIELGLPEQGFVFCSFNNAFKITPTVFDVWMRLLRNVQGSVLWLLRGNPTAEANLRREAQIRGVDPERLVFAPRMGAEDHLARYRVADLFVDTFPCNAHVTASDALWVGLPFLTCVGRSFASRVAASLLCAMNLEELVTDSLKEYERRALELASNRALLQQIRERIAKNRRTTPLFDTNRFREQIESAYIAMYERQRRGERPQGFTVEPT
jgi:protein O-GlcNAc transferase